MNRTAQEPHKAFFSPIPDNFLKNQIYPFFALIKADFN